MALHSPKPPRIYSVEIATGKEQILEHLDKVDPNTIDFDETFERLTSAIQDSIIRNVSRGAPVEISVGNPSINVSGPLSKEQKMEIERKCKKEVQHKLDHLHEFVAFLPDQTKGTV